MKTARTHITNFGSFLPAFRHDFQGYITYHDSPKYNAMTKDELRQTMSEHRLSACRAAAAVALAGFVMTIIVFSGGVVHLTLGGDELRQRVWECQDEIGDRSQEGWEFCMDLLTKPAPSEDGC